jgi:hypothetical protein
MEYQYNAWRLKESKKAISPDIVLVILLTVSYHQQGDSDIDYSYGFSIP